MKIEDLKEYHKNPRKIGEERFEKLADSLKRLGDLGGIVVNLNTNEIIGGNQRVKTFMQEREKYEIEITKKIDIPMSDGTVAFGYVVKDKGTAHEQRFSYREVQWDEKQAEEANVVANKLTGFWDFDILANSFEIDSLLAYGFSQQDLDLLPKTEKIEMDKDGLAKSLDSYLDGNIKQIVLPFKSEDFESVVQRLDNVMKRENVPSHTEAFLKLLECYENTASQKEARTTH